MSKKSNTNKIQTFQNNILRKISNSSPHISNQSNLALHTDLKIKTVYEESVLSINDSTPNFFLISNLATLTTPGNPGNSPRRFKWNWGRDLFNDLSKE